MGKGAGLSQRETAAGLEEGQEDTQSHVLSEQAWGNATHGAKVEYLTCLLHFHCHSLLWFPIQQDKDCSSLFLSSDLLMR